MILYCCCHDAYDDTDSHASCSRSCFGSFFSTMKLSARDKRINGILRDLRGEEFIHDCTINVQCSASYLLSHAVAIFDGIQQVMPPFKNSVITVAKGVVYSNLCLVDDPFNDAAWDGFYLDVPAPAPAPAPIYQEEDDDLPF